MTSKIVAFGIGLGVLGLGVAGYLLPDKWPSQITCVIGLWLVYHSLFLRGKLKPLQEQTIKDQYGGGGVA